MAIKFHLVSRENKNTLPSAYLCHNCETILAMHRVAVKSQTESTRLMKSVRCGREDLTGPHNALDAVLLRKHLVSDRNYREIPLRLNSLERWRL